MTHTLRARVQKWWLDFDIVHTVGMLVVSGIAILIGWLTLWVFMSVIESVTFFFRATL